MTGHTRYQVERLLHSLWNDAFYLEGLPLKRAAVYFGDVERQQLRQVIEALAGVEAELQRIHGKEPA